jgi:hypothetical protein
MNSLSVDVCGDLIEKQGFPCRSPRR